MTHATKTPTTTWHGLAIEYEYRARFPIQDPEPELIDWWLAAQPVDDAELLADFLAGNPRASWPTAAAEVLESNSCQQGALDWIVTTFAREIDAACEDDYAEKHSAGKLGFAREDC